MQRHQLARIIGTALMAAAVALPAGGWGPLGATTRAATPDCTTGWTDASEAPNLSIYDTIGVGARGVSVGTERQLAADRSYVTSWWRDGAWVTKQGPAMNGDAGLVAVGGDRIGHLWAVGFEDDGRARGIAVHWESGRWVRHDPPRPASGGMVLSAVDVDPAGHVWAVGQSVSERVTRTGLVLERRGGAWRRASVTTGAGAGFTAVRALAADDVWVVGSRLTQRGLRPLVAHWNGRDWSVRSIPAAGDDAVLSSIAGTSRDDLWAVGWTTADGTTRPLVLHRDADGWHVVDPPVFAGLFAMLADVSVDAEGRPWVVGADYRDTVDLYAPVAARLDGTTWTRWPRPPGTGRYLDAVSGDPPPTGGRAAGATSVGCGCAPASRSPRPAPGRHVAGRGASRPVDDLAGDEAGPVPRRGLPRVPRLAPATEPAGLAPRDIAVAVGIRQSTRTYGATWAISMVMAARTCSSLAMPGRRSCTCGSPGASSANPAACSGRSTGTTVTSPASMRTTWPTSSAPAERTGAWASSRTRSGSTPSTGSPTTRARPEASRTRPGVDDRSPSSTSRGMATRTSCWAPHRCAGTPSRRRCA